uniref:D-alanyl-D-alanine carboxypeptidase n=1 Tax=Caldimicrobium thiodismutans TaxID=1653476 RepID=A0A832LVM1_9BACT
MIRVLVFILVLLTFFILPIRAEENLEYYENIISIAGVALDGNTGQILYAKNPHIKIPPASTVKLLTAMVVLDRLPLSQKVKISNNAENTPTTPPHLQEGEIFTVEDLLYLMLLKSSNQAAVALAEAVAGNEERFSELMNQKARMLGLKNSHFVTASGLPASNQYTTAYELALLLYEALKYPHIKEIINTPVKIISSQQGRTLVIRNTNKLLFEEEIRENILGGKTGYTKLSKHCLVNVAKVKDRLVITSLLGAPYREALWEDTKKLIRFSELVFDRKVSPVVINTAVTTALPVSMKPSAYYRESKRASQNQKNIASTKRTRQVLALKSSSKNKPVLAKNSLVSTKAKVQVAKANTSKGRNAKSNKKLYRAENPSPRNS